MVAWTETQKSKAGLLRRLLALLSDQEVRPAIATPQLSLPKMPSVDAIDTLHVVMVGFGDGDLAAPARWLADQGARVQWLSPRLGTLEDLASSLGRVGAKGTHVIVDIKAVSRQASGVLDALNDRRPKPNRPGTITHVMVDIDALGGIVVAYDGLRLLRNQRPNLPVIVVSEDLSANDFSLERLPLCDASLRAPVAYSALEYALTESREVNNPAWVARLKEMRAGI